VLKFTKRQRMIYYLFWTAYTTVVDAEDFRAFFGEKLEWYYGFELLVSRMLGFAKKNGDKYFMTD